MPITPPTFQIQLLSPAALLDSGSDRDDSFDRAVELGQQYYYQQQLTERSNQLATQRQRELAGLQHQSSIAQIFARDLAAGELIPVEEASLPGEVSLEDLPTITSPGGREYISRTAINEAETRGRRTRPVEELGGRETIEGTTYEDLFTDDGRERSAAQVARFVQGDFNAFESTLRGMIPEGASPEMFQLAEDLVQRARTDPSFTEEERSALESSFRDSVERTRLIADSVRAHAEMDRETRAAVGSAMGNAIAGLQVLENGQRRFLRSEEAYVLGMRNAGLRNQLNQEQEALLQRMESSEGGFTLVPRADFIDRRDKVLENYIGAGNSQSEDFHSAMRFFQGIMINPRTGEVVNREVAEDVQRIAGGRSEEHIADWLATDNANPYRRAWSIYSEYGYTTYDEIVDHIMSGDILPQGFLSEPTLEAYSKMFPNFFSNGNRGIRLDEDRPINEPLTAGEAESAYQGSRQSFMDAIDGADPILVDGFTATLEENKGRPSEAASALRSHANRLRSRNPEAAAWFESMASLVSGQTAAQNRQFADSIVAPAVTTLRNNTRN